MKCVRAYPILLVVLIVATVATTGRLTSPYFIRAAVLPAREQRATLTVDYPAEGSMFPPEFPPPTFLWRDADENAVEWSIDVGFSDGSTHIKTTARGDRMMIGEIDRRCVGTTNEPPKLTPEQAAARTWTPDDRTWAAIKKHSLGLPATVTITGFRAGKPQTPTSQGHVIIQTSKDPVGAPIFYRDVPLMPSQSQKGVIKPLAANAIPLIAWRLRYVGESRSRLLMEGLHTCANCHSFSLDGKTLGMDVDGPGNDKGLYALAPIKPQMSIRNEDVIKWSSYRGRLGGQLRVGFMSQVSPDGQYVVTTINDPGTESREHLKDLQGKYYVTNFKDYRFLQVFYPTRGILAWYSRTTGLLQPLPGADQPRYVQTDGVWSPDGKYLVYARAEARDPYPKDGIMAEFANDPKETQIQYDLCRIPFSEGKGGEPELIVGASQNGSSNNFPKVSPDGRWIVFVQCRNGQLMRPDSQLYIVPAQGGAARRMRCNTPLMNSWHSFSPNGRWLVFSSKSRSPYTQMFLTHLDEQGQDSPAILIENATAANRAVNIPEFVNVPRDGLLKIDAPAAEFYRVFDLATELAEKKQFEAAISEWRRATELGPDDARAYNNFGIALTATGRIDEAITQYQKALAIDPEYSSAFTSLGVALARTGKFDEALPSFEKALQLDPGDAVAHINLGAALLATGRIDEAITHFQIALAINPEDPEANANLGIALAKTGKFDEAIPHFEKALTASLDSGEIRYYMGFALLEKGRPDEAIPHLERALVSNPDSVEMHRSLGRALAEKGRFDEAIPHFEKALAAKSDSAEIHYNLGRLLVLTRRWSEAISHFEKVLQIAPTFVEADYNLGVALYYMHIIPKAMEHWRKVLLAQPDHLPALNRLAWVLAASADASLRNGTEAISLAQQAAQLSGDQEPAILDTLAAAYAEAGRFPEATQTARRALELARQKNNQDLTGVLSIRIALYEANTPVREK